MTDYSEPLVHLKQQIKLLEDGLSQKMSKDALYTILFSIEISLDELIAYIRSLEK